MQTLINNTLEFIKKHNLIDDGDKIAIGLSGGKDSLSLLNILSVIKTFYEKKFELIAIAIDLFDGKTDYTAVQNFCKERNVELTIIPSNIYELLFEIRKEKNPCSLCSKLRKGYLMSKAKELGCNKVALGHHADDLIETYFLSLIYEGRISTFTPQTYLDRTQITQIRPMLRIREKDIIKHSKELPIIINECPADKNTKREKVKDIIKQMETLNPKFAETLIETFFNKERWQNFFKI